jgi:hypothetical protein
MPPDPVNQSSTVSPWKSSIIGPFPSSSHPPSIAMESKLECRCSWPIRGKCQMRLHAGLLVLVLVVSAVAPAAADFNNDTHPYAQKCRAASFARRGPGALSNAMRNAEIQRCIKNKGTLD